MIAPNDRACVVIQVNCPACGKSYKIAPRSQGKQGTCRDCGTQFCFTQRPSKVRLPKSQVIARPRPPNAADREKQVQRLLDQFGEFPRLRVTLAHRFTALLVACVMILLPLLYVAFTAAVARITWWHITHNYIWIIIPGIRAMVVAFFAYIGLSVVGVLWVFSLIRPLFMRLTSKSAAKTGLSREDEPLLYEFAEKLADKMGAPNPELIRLDLDVNASASYAVKAFGLRRGAFTLTLGIPLIAGLTLPQLAGVMAHEFGHFSQRGSTLLDRLIRRVNLWLFIAVHQRDVIDDMIDYLTSLPSAIVVLVGFVMWIVVWLGRAVLWCLMHVGLLVSASLMRRMEFDADRYEAGVTGSEVFETTSERIILLNVAHTMATNHVFKGRQGDYLPRDYAAFVVGLADESKVAQKKTRKLVKSEKLQWLGSHPTTRSRIRAAKKLKLPGALHSDLPASVLFKDFAKECRELSHILYEARYGPGYYAGTRRATRDAVRSYLETMERG